MSRYIIRTDEPFKGWVQSVINADGTIGYTQAATLDDYAAEVGAPLRVIDDDELNALMLAFQADLICDPTEITEERFYDALNVLPPCRWGHHRGVELFHISELLHGDLANWYAQLNGRYFAFVDHCTADPERLAAKIAGATS